MIAMLTAISAKIEMVIFLMRLEILAISLLSEKAIWYE